jgi:hypothetical protein
VFDEDATLINFSDFLCGKLRLREQQKTAIVQDKVDGTDTLLSRIEKDGKTNLPVTVENERAGKHLDSQSRGNASFVVSTSRKMAM